MLTVFIDIFVLKRDRLVLVSNQYVLCLYVLWLYVLWLYVLCL